jgi:SAM-dependent methyltransferase
MALGHYAIYDRVETLLAGKSPAKLLDVPAGEGALAKRLLAAGFDVSCCDLYPEIFRLDGVAIDRGDLDARLPYADSSFDIIVCVEGLEHIENPANAIREFARLLRQGGRLIVSVPNIMNVEERLKWLVNGYTSHFKPLSAEAIRDHKYHEMGGREEIAWHINPLGYAEVRFLLEQNGFRLGAVHPDRKKRNTWIFAPVVWAIRAAGLLQDRGKRAARWTDELNSDSVLAGGNTLIFDALKL